MPARKKTGDEGGINIEGDLRHFMDMQDMAFGNSPVHSAELWDKRAESWEAEYQKPGEPKGQDRVQATVTYLRAQGLLGPEDVVADIGCGPGRFAAAFAATARQVIGYDISPKMIGYGMTYARRQGLDNVLLQVRDFQNMDIEAEGLAGRFDLVFSSNTPAIHGMDALRKSIAMSRKFCCNITHVHSENELESRILAELFDRQRRSVWTGHWFYSLFNVLFLLGYYPQTSYFRRRKERGIEPSPEYGRLFMEQHLPEPEQTEENLGRIVTWLQKQAGPGGLVTEISEMWYGRNLWDVRENSGQRRSK